MSELDGAQGFDLDRAVAEWRGRLCEQSNVQEQDAQELEGHLRDGIERLKSLGLSGEEAFWVSAGRLGDPTALSREFGKVDHRRAVTKAIRIAIGALSVLQIVWWTKITPSLLSLFLYPRLQTVDNLSLGINYLLIAAGFAGFAVAIRPDIFRLVTRLVEWCNFAAVAAVIVVMALVRVPTVGISISTLSVSERVRQFRSQILTPDLMRVSLWFTFWLIVPPFLVAVLLAVWRPSAKGKEEVV